MLSWPHAAERYYTPKGCTDLVEAVWFPVTGTTSSNVAYSTEYDTIFYRLAVAEDIR